MPEERAFSNASGALFPETARPDVNIRSEGAKPFGLWASPEGGFALSDGRFSAQKRTAPRYSEPFCIRDASLVAIGWSEYQRMRAKCLHSETRSASEMLHSSPLGEASILKYERGRQSETHSASGEAPILSRADYTTGEKDSATLVSRIRDLSP